MTPYKMPLSETDAKALVDEATAALDAGDEDKAIEIGRVLVQTDAPYVAGVYPLLVRLYPILKRRGITKETPNGT